MARSAPPSRRRPRKPGSRSSPGSLNLPRTAGSTTPPSVTTGGVAGAPPAEPFPRAATGVGRSMLVDPLGVVRADLGPGPGVTVAEVDVDLIETVRASLPR